jgi:hypothetical protein
MCLCLYLLLGFVSKASFSFAMEHETLHRNLPFICPEKRKQELEQEDGLSFRHRTRTGEESTKVLCTLMRTQRKRREREREGLRRKSESQLQLVLIIDHDTLSWRLVHHKSLLSVLETFQLKWRLFCVFAFMYFLTLSVKTSFLLFAMESALICREKAKQKLEFH